ncbi:unnamed protein product [Ceratitis capitata]|uniref:(Mediterranean fruit fly) hypothetical protein n=1 Tax=Ceratitis capitata TaxID=7213 RepID=A0A811U1J2_CERCA|nr:unnamed protein product [Ceratitis capitata]
MKSRTLMLLMLHDHNIIKSCSGYMETEMQDARPVAAAILSKECCNSSNNNNSDNKTVPHLRIAHPVAPSIAAQQQLLTTVRRAAEGGGWGLEAGCWLVVSCVGRHCQGNWLTIINGLRK